MSYTILITTLGCKVNQYDSGALRKLFFAKGFAPFDGAGDGCPDVVIVNTCIVSSESERKSRQAIRRMRSRYPKALLAVAGCYPQRFPEQVAAIEGVGFTAGISGHEALVERIASRLQNNECNRDESLSPEDSAGAGERTRAYVKIQDGCDNFCSYCIVPYTRGRARSRMPDEVLDEVDAAVASGAPEIVLTGIHISAYRSLGGLGELIDNISERLRRQNHPIRLRLSSLEPTVITPEFVMLLAKNRDIICPHFHLSLQSGSETVLRRMNRAYVPEQYREAVTMLRRQFPGAGITTDIIVGFPGEDEAEFMETFDFCRDIAFLKIHVFPYSKRPGTKAADLPDQVAPRDKRDRVGRLIALSDELSLDFHRAYLGKDIRFLVERVSADLVEGISGNYIRVRASPARFPPEDAARGNNASIRGEYATVLVTDATPSHVIGNLTT